MSTWIKVYFLVVMNLDKGLQGYSVSDYSPCSCYTFDGRLKSWSEGRQQCRTQGGDLVSMETVGEWEFIKTQIQNRTTEPRGENEWWIGLEKRDGKWEWLTNHTLTYNKWQPGEPSVWGENDKCVIISKNYPVNTYGLLNNVNCGIWRGWICEYKRRDINCNESQVRWCGKESRKEQETTKIPDQKTKTSVTTSTTIKQPTSNVEATKTAATSEFATDCSTDTPYKNKPTQQKTTPLRVQKESDPITSVAENYRLTNTGCLPYPLLVTAIFVCVLGGLAVLAAVAFLLVPFVLKSSRSSIAD